MRLKKSKLWQSHYYEIKSYLWHTKGKLGDKKSESRKKAKIMTLKSWNYI